MKTQKERDKFLISEMRKRLDHFFRINVTQVGDMVPKIISNFLVNAILVLKRLTKEQNLLFDVQESLESGRAEQCQGTRPHRGSKGQVQRPAQDFEEVQGFVDQGR